MFETFRLKLAEYLPGPSAPLVAEWFVMNRVNLIFTRGRRSKTGDFRPPRNGSLPQISVNKTLNRYACLITIIHEMAHYQVFEAHRAPTLFHRRKRIQPHGKEWKKEYQRLMVSYLTPDIFPAEIRDVLSLHMQNPRATTYSDSQLARVLFRYDRNTSGVMLEELPAGAHFTTTGGMLFRKEQRLRKRFKCLRLNDRKVYLFSPLAMVTLVNAEK